MKYDKLAESTAIEEVQKALESKNFQVFVLGSGQEALEEIKRLVPKGASVMNGTSTTLEQVGFIDYLKSGQHDWKNLHEKILLEQDQEKQNLFRKQATISDYYLGSVHAITKDGDLVIASNTGSQIPGIVFNSSNLIFVVSTKKIVVDFADALNRIEQHVIPLEDIRMKKVYGFGTALNKILIFKGENDFSGRKTCILLVQEDLGF